MSDLSTLRGPQDGIEETQSEVCRCQGIYGALPVYPPRMWPVLPSLRGPYAPFPPETWRPGDAGSYA